MLFSGRLPMWCGCVPERGLPTSPDYQLSWWTIYVMACAGPSIQRRGGVPAKGLVSHRVPWGPGGLCLTLLSVPQHQEEGACQGLLGASQSHTSPSTTEAHLSSRTPCLRNALASQLSKTDLMMWNTFSISLLLAWTENVCVNFLQTVAFEVQVYSYKIVFLIV